MTECFMAYRNVQTFGFKRNPLGKQYTAKFDLVERDDKFEIWSLGVVERYRRKGYATQMLMEFLSQFKSGKPLSLYVVKTNEIAIRLYEKVGFSIVGDYKYGSYAYEMQFGGRKEQEK